ncbi:WD repeat-containing protein [Ceratobasidium sp. AG-Ba]|nr:WD repeat-containing protein [Ceratobasidium sp. AG-Ba]
MPARRISYVIPAPQEPPPLFALPPPGVPRNGQTTPLLIPAPAPGADAREPLRSTLRASHPQHRLPVSALALDTSTQLVDRPTPEGILYTSGRDGLVAAWELGVAMRRRPGKAKEKKRHWEALTGWDDSEDSDEDDGEDDGDGLDGILRPPRQKKARPPVDEAGWPYERRWEAASDELKPAQFRQSVQLHTDWINDIVLCNMNRTVVSASSDGTLRTYNPHTTDAPNILGTHTDYARCLAYAPGPRFVASGSFDRTIKLWDISRAYSPSNLASSSSPELTTLSLDEADPKSSIYAVATDPAGSVIAAGGPERVVRIWDPRIGLNGGEARCLSALRGHTDNIRAILISEDGRYVLTGSSDASIKLWSLPMRRCIHTFSVHADSVWALHSTHSQLHTFFSGDRAGWICRFDVTQPVPSSNSQRPGFAGSVGGAARYSIAGTLNKETEMELSDAFCVVLGRAGAEPDCAKGHETSHGITALTAMDDTWVWAASGDSSVQRWRGVGAVGSMADNWGSRGKGAGSPSPPRIGSPPPRVGSPGPKNSSSVKPSSPSAMIHGSPPSAMVHTNSGPGRKRVSIDVSRQDSAPAPSHTQTEYETSLVQIPARVPRPSQPDAMPVPYTSLVRLASPNPFQLRAARDPETATLYSHSGISVHRNVHREDLAMGSGFFGLPGTSPAAGAMYTAPVLNHTNSLPLVSTSPGLGAPPLNHTNSNLPLVTSPTTAAAPNPSSLPIASDVSDSNIVPLCTEPADVIAGSYGLVRSVVLNDRIHALSVDTRGEVAVWDVVRGICRGVFTLDQSTSGGSQKISPREALDLVRDRIEGESMTPAWASVDTRVGDLTVHLIEPKCFDAEVYADEIEWLDVKALAGGEEDSEHRLNLGKWVLANLFAEFIRAELAMSAELAAPTPRANTSGLPAPSAIPSLPPVSEGQPTAPEDGINSIPGLPPPSPLLRTPRGRPMHIPLPTRTRSASEASMGGFGLGLGLMSPSGSGLGSATLAPMMSPAILPENELPPTIIAPNLNILSPIRELQSPSVSNPEGPSTVSTVGPGIGQGDYFSSAKVGRDKDTDAGAATPGVPMATPGNPVTPGGGGLMGRLKNLGKTGKRGAATPGGTALGIVPGSDAATNNGENEVEEDKDPERTKHLNLLTSLLSSPLAPPHPQEAPPILFPPNTAVTISEATADASGWMAVFAGSTGTLGADVEALEMAIPGWMLEYLLAGRLSIPPSAAASQKLGFMLIPWKGGKEVLPELVGSQSRLTASRFLRVSKVVSYVHDKLHATQQHEQTQPPTEEERKSHESVGAIVNETVQREYEILCNEQVLSVGMTLAAVRQYVWRNANELVMHYRVKEA